jgi:hypothetical protein
MFEVSFCDESKEILCYILEELMIYFMASICQEGHERNIYLFI